jgi:hypothetical protein
MKKSMITKIVLGFMIPGIFTACISSQSFFPVKGTGELTDRDFTVTDFHGIDVSGGFDVALVQGDSEGVVLSAQENLYDYIHVEVVQGILKIYTEGNLMSTRSLKARISFKQLNELKVSGGGDVNSLTNINTPDLGIEISGGGDLTTDVNTASLNCKISGGGDVKVNGTAKSYKMDLSGGGDLESDIDAGSIGCYLSGGGDLKLICKEVADAMIEINGGGDVNATMNAGKLRCSISGGGNATLKGKVTDLDINITGGGDVSAAGFSADMARIQASGGSDIHVMVSKELHGNVSGGGDLYYSGSPAIVSIDTRGGSEIHKE